MKKSIAVGLFVLVGAWCFSSDGATVTHLDIDFSDYTLGDVAGQMGAVSGAWVAPSTWFGTVVSANGYVAGTQSLEVYRTGSGRGYVPLDSGLSLAAADKIYMAVDLYSKDPSGNLDVMLSNGSPGTIANLGFGFQFNGTGNGLKFISDTTGGTLRTDTAFKPAEDTWYRIEFEITQSATAGVGTYSVFISTQGGGTRTAVLTDQAYSFATATLPTLYVVPVSKSGSSSNATAINNVVLQSGLADFPVNPISGTAATITHLNVDFSNYALGDVKGQSGGTVAGTWSGGSMWTGTVVEASGYIAGTQVLNGYRGSGSGSANRGRVGLASSISLASSNKIYMAADLSMKSISGATSVELALVNDGSEGTVTNKGFGCYIVTDHSVKFADSTVGGTASRIDSGLVLSPHNWYRFEWEITPGATPGKGTFSVFESVQGTAGRVALFEDQSYDMAETTFTRFAVLFPALNASADDSVLLNNFVVQSGMTNFPFNPISEPVTIIRSLSRSAGNILKMVIDCPTPSTSYPKIKTDLITGSWESVGHSTSSGGPFTTNNLGTVPGAITIYLEANDTSAFYAIGEE